MTEHINKSYTHTYTSTLHSSNTYTMPTSKPIKNFSGMVEANQGENPILSRIATDLYAIPGMSAKWKEFSVGTCCTTLRSCTDCSAKQRITDRRNQLETDSVACNMYWVFASLVGFRNRNKCLGHIGQWWVDRYRWLTKECQVFRRLMMRQIPPTILCIIWWFHRLETWISS
jgi:hypothetical protein